MVGDGINDAPALTVADMGIAIGAAAMSISSFFVVSNALRLNLFDVHDGSKDRVVKKNNDNTNNIKKGVKMAFVNDYLTEEEIEKFKELNISYGKKICITSNEIVGTEKSTIKGGVICTIDRSNGMYLFYCGDDYGFGREELWSPEFFVFIKEKQNELIVTRVGLKRKHFNNYSLQVWSLYSINSKCYETNIEYDSKNILAYLKEALTTYGFDGDPREIDDESTEFDF